MSAAILPKTNRLFLLCFFVVFPSPCLSCHLFFGYRGSAGFSGCLFAPRGCFKCIPCRNDVSCQLGHCYAIVQSAVTTRLAGSQSRKNECKNATSCTTVGERGETMLTSDEGVNFHCPGNNFGTTPPSPSYDWIYLCPRTLYGNPCYLSFQQPTTNHSCVYYLLYLGEKKNRAVLFFFACIIWRPRLSGRWKSSNRTQKGASASPYQYIPCPFELKCKGQVRGM